MANTGKIDGNGHAYKRAQNHSRRVKWVKWLLPIAAFVGVVTIAAAMVVSRVLPDVGVELSESTISDGKLVMANPKLDGFTTDKRPYRVTATRAIQDLSGQNSEMLLETLRADVKMKDGSTALLTSATGVFDSEASLLKLEEEAVFTTSDGMRAVLGKSDINIQSGSILASGKVRVTNQETDITSENMQVIDGGSRIIFEDNVRVVMRPKVVSKQTDAVITDARTQDTVSGTN